MRLPAVTSRVALVALVVTAPACFSVCEKTRSVNVRTGGIHAAISVTAVGAGPTDVEAELRVGGGFSTVYVEVGDGDALTFSSGGAEQPLGLDRGVLGQLRYRARVNADLGGKLLSVAFKRPADTSAVSTVLMPMSFIITSPAPGQRLSRAKGPLALAWTPASSDPISWTIRGRCVDTASGQLPAGGDHLDVPTPVCPTTDAGGPVECPVTLEIVRFRRGSIDPAYGEGGSITATQTQETVFVSAP